MVRPPVCNGIARTVVAAAAYSRVLEEGGKLATSHSRQCRVTRARRGVLSATRETASRAATH